MRVLIIIAAIGLAFAAGYWTGQKATVPISFTGKLPPVWSGIQIKNWSAELPPLTLNANGRLNPKTDAIDVHAILISTDAVHAMSAEFHIDGSLQNPRWTLKSLKKKNVRLEFQL